MANKYSNGNTAQTADRPATQTTKGNAMVKPQQSQLMALVETDSAAAKKDMQRLGKYGEARTKAVTGAFQQVIDQSNEDIAQFIQERYQGDSDFFDPLAYLDFSPQIGLNALNAASDAVTVEVLPSAS